MTLLTVRALLAVRRYRSVAASSQRVRDRSLAAVDASREASMVCRSIEAVGQRTPGCTCLVQALAAQRMLGRRGVATKLQIGARRGDDEGLDAHAWLERNGEIILGGGTAPYHPLPLPPHTESSQ